MRIIGITVCVLTAFGAASVQSSNAANCRPGNKTELKEVLSEHSPYRGTWRGVSSNGELKVTYRKSGGMSRRYSIGGRWYSNRGVRYVPTSGNTFTITFGTGSKWRYKLNNDCSIIGNGLYQNNRNSPVRVSLKPG